MRALSCHVTLCECCALEECDVLHVCKKEHSITQHKCVTWWALEGRMVECEIMMDGLMGRLDRQMKRTGEVIYRNTNRGRPLDTITGTDIRLGGTCDV